MTFRICMVCDFFFPNFGGVESHIFSLSQSLLQRNNKVIIVTHSYDDRIGIRYLVNGLKVYYLPIKVIYNQSTMPTIISSLPLVRYVLLRERINIVHGHAAFSAITHEIMLIAQIMNIRTVFTDHSLFGFADISAIITNTCLHMSLIGCNRLICVSYIGKENTALRSRVEPNNVSVIPNAVDAGVFKPNIEARPKNRIVVVFICRLVYRKGVDLLADVMVNVCEKYRQVYFLIGGDGPKKQLLMETIERHDLHKRIELLGSLKQSEVCDVLNKGHIFLNTSLTEAYCMAIVEAACCGLPVVTTCVGGIPEVLPDPLVYLCQPTVSDLTEGLDKAINDYMNGKTVSPEKSHEMIKDIYNWKNVSSRTEIVYKKALAEPDRSIGQQFRIYCKSGVYPFLLIISLVFWILKILDWLVPKSEIDITPDFIRSKHLSLNEKRIGIKKRLWSNN